MTPVAKKCKVIYMEEFYLLVPYYTTIRIHHCLIHVDGIFRVTNTVSKRSDNVTIESFFD